MPSFQQRSEETAELLSEKSHIAEEERTLLQQKSTKSEEEVRRIKMQQVKVSPAGPSRVVIPPLAEPCHLCQPQRRPSPEAGVLTARY